MVRFLIFLAAAMQPQLAWAHLGHVGEYAGHDHVVAGIAIGLAIALGLREALKGRKEETEDGDQDTAEVPS